MKNLQVGDRGKGYCLDCIDMMNITYRLRDVPFSDGVGLAKGLLVGVCDGCDTTIALPAQCIPAVAAARKAGLAEAGLAQVGPVKLAD